MLSGEAKNTNFIVFGLTQQGDQTHDLKKEITSDGVISPHYWEIAVCITPSEELLRFI